MISVADVLKAIYDKKSLDLFRVIAFTKPDTDIPISKTKLTRKQYYSRLYKLMKAGLIKRKTGKYSLTTFGKVIYGITLTSIETAINYHWKFNAIDSLETSNYLTTVELGKVIDNFIDNQQIKDVLVSNNSKFESTGPFVAELVQQEQTHRLKQRLLAY